jgi:hypothetical protein
MHPHDSDSIVRVAYKKPVDKSIIKKHLIDSIISAGDIYKHIKKLFNNEAKNE